MLLKPEALPQADSTEFGVKTYSLEDGPLAVITAPTWEEFMETLNTAEIPDEAVILTPNLITSIRSQKSETVGVSDIHRRVIEVQRWSINRPNVVVALGTMVAPLEPLKLGGSPADSGEPRPGVVYICGGHRIDQEYTDT